MRVVHLDEIEPIRVEGTLNWKPIRKTLGVTAFGVNAYRAEQAGDEVVEDHDETRLGHEEIYLVLAGTATFTVAGRAFDAPAGTLVYLDDPSEQRGAVAKEAGTTVLAVGGVPGTHEISAWEYFFPAAPYAHAGDYRRAKEIVEEGLAHKPNHPALLYNLACYEAQLGEADAALEHLNAAVTQEDRFREYAASDDDFAAIRADPRFPT
jgi:tetratricopeptide (TPR) repeat protein